MIKRTATMLGQCAATPGDEQPGPGAAQPRPQNEKNGEPWRIVRSLARAISAGPNWLLGAGCLASVALLCWLVSRPFDSMYVAAAVVFCVACAVSAMSTLVVRKAALRLGLIDRPDACRKLHVKDTPLGGGLAIFAATGAVLAVLLVVPNVWQYNLRQTMSELAPLFLAATVIVFVGLADDRLKLRGRYKLLGQCLAACVVIFGGFSINSIGILGWHVELGLLSIPFTLFWLLGAINALNLMDGIDGLATTVGLILVSAIATMAALTGNPLIALAAVVFAGSLLGFLLFNLPPASIFLGDAGSMLIGLVVGVLSIEGSLKGPGTVLLAAPLALWTIPVFDSLAAVLRRKLTGRSLYTTDRNHIHHRLYNRLGSSRRVLALIGATCVLTAGAGLISVYSKSDLAAVVTSVAVVAVFVLTGLFGRVELALLVSRCRLAGRALVQRGNSARDEAWEQVFHLQGSRDWRPLWQVLTAMRLGSQVAAIHLDINWPAEHEEFHATWQRPHRTDTGRLWRMDVPFLVARHSFSASVAVLGQVDGTSPQAEIEAILPLLSEFESRLMAFLDNGHVSGTGVARWEGGQHGGRQAVSAIARSHPR